MHGSGEMSAVLAARRTLTLNREWEQYWQQKTHAALRAFAA
jgi:hypothetical protein